MRDLFLVAPLLCFLLIVFVVPDPAFHVPGGRQWSALSQLSAHPCGLADWESPAEVPEAAYRGAGRRSQGRSQILRELAVIARTLNNFEEGFRSLLMKTANKLPDDSRRILARDASSRSTSAGSIRSRWAMLKHETGRYTTSFLLAALDLKRDATGESCAYRAERRLYVPLLMRTFEISLSVAVICLLVGYPTAYVLTGSRRGSPGS